MSHVGEQRLPCLLALALRSAGCKHLKPTRQAQKSTGTNGIKQCSDLAYGHGRVVLNIPVLPNNPREGESFLCMGSFALCVQVCLKVV